MNLEEIVSDCITIEELSYKDGIHIIRGTLLMESKQAFKMMVDRLKPFNLVPLLREKDDKVEVTIRRLPEIKKKSPMINFVLLGITLYTTIIAGCLLSGVNPLKEPDKIFYGVPFSLALLFILGAHELGHYFACKLQNVYATPPYFIPVPPPIFLLGTFGAIIRIKTPIQDKEGLLKIGVAGPLIGFLIAIPIVIIGLKLSKFEPLLPTRPHISLGNSIIFWILTKLFVQPPPTGYDLSLHPVAFAGWVGMFVTAINLLPMGQLDGGHISYALFGRKAKFIALPFVIIMVGLSFYWPGWLLWALLTLMFGIKHPPPLNDISPLGQPYKIVGIIAIFVFIITFVPIPFRLHL